MNPLKETQKTYLITAFGLLIFASAVFYLLHSEAIEGTEKYSNILYKVLPMSIVIGLSASFYLGNKYLKQARLDKSMDKKLKNYHQSILFKNICLLIPGFIACISSLISGEVQFLFIALAILIVMWIAFPFKSKAKTALELSEKEISEFDKLTNE